MALQSQERGPSDRLVWFSCPLECAPSVRGLELESLAVHSCRVPALASWGQRAVAAEGRGAWRWEGSRCAGTAERGWQGSGGEGCWGAGVRRVASGEGA